MSEPSPAPATTDANSVSIAPSPRLPLAILLLSAALLPLPLRPWPSLVVGLFGLFLLVQTYSLRLEFCVDTLVVWRGQQELRRFPYAEWQSWRLFAAWLPGLLFFREVNSIHFLPILFDPAQLREQLVLRVGALEQPTPQNNTP
ncbi:hypothetical protein SynMEDNS5_02125 [Synechococcus sp. MEDNS5]|uniref:DUF3119 family protein n=1 Tax=Synechococcus sp. MEDNS5 TaxID=1442554 RepID=UPI0016489DDE|nr:DUF3119 family protein [Synechococcus sp. MEDNS5]QNJ06828.1 hypothetical protein SynMEDNS5_02125 [Synechococcus sp. MEDNS5]